MKEIGGFFELELDAKNEYHIDAIRLNTARNALEYILKSKNYTKIFIPYFTCDVLMQPIEKLKVACEFYSIDEKFEPIFDFSKIKGNECFLYTNYFGLKDSFVNKISLNCKNLIIDNAQSFYSKPIDNVDTFYSARKFFGLPDGGYLYTDKKIEEDYKKDLSYERFEHLLRRIDENAEAGYKSFTENDKKLDNLPILEMSNLTHKILDSIDYDSVKSKRIKNYKYLHQSLKDRNLLKFEKSNVQVPLVYPFWTKDLKLKKTLIENKIYCATYWPNILEWCKEDSLEVMLTKELIHIPIDQRYGINEMDLIINIPF
jgi:hypothetical protein